MHPIQQFSPGVLAAIVRRQPDSAARTSFAWSLAVGAAIARSTRVEVANGVLHVVARDPRWEREVRRAAPAIVPRMQHLLGPDAVRSMQVVSDRRDA